MLERQFKFNLNPEKEYDISYNQDSDWSNSKRRLLIIMQTVPGLSLAKKELVPKGLVRDTLSNCIRFSRSIAREYGKEAAGFSFTVVAFNAWKHLHLKGPARADAEVEFAARARKLVKKLNPTHVLVSGDRAAAALLPKVENVPYKRGWVHELNGMKMVNTIDLDKMLEKQGLRANLLGFWCRHLANLMMGKHPHDLSHIKADPRYIDSIEKFDTMMKHMKKLGPEDYTAVDTETANLSVHHNSIYTLQLCSSKRPEVGYVIPINHPMTHFDASEIKYMKKELKKWFSQTDGPILITFNGMFDLRVIREEFKIPIIRNKVWEVTAGEHLLDENAAELVNVGPAMGGLRAIYCSYGNDHYFRASFTKEDRMTTGTTDPSEKQFLEYAATDVVSIMAIMGQQKLRARRLEIDGRNYEPIFTRHMLYMMSDTAHQLSHLRADGSYVDRSYLQHLLSAESPLRSEIRNEEVKLKKSKHAQDANKALLKANGMKAGSLFGGNTDQWVLKLSKGAHKVQLFYDTMGLEVVSQTESGEPAVDKVFIDEYKSKYEEVKILDEWGKLSKLLGTYVRGWQKQLNKSVDSIKDGYLRPDYSFWDVSTGRLSSKNPSLQTIPTRSHLAKIIKRMFVAPKGCLLIRYDYSAHEVRMWSVVSGDMTLAAAFKAGQDLRKKLIQKPTAEIRKELKTKGDIHIQNVYRFWGKWVDKNDPLRDAVKAVVFGVLYGKSAKSLGEDIKKDEKYAQSIIDKMFSQFKDGAKWTKKMKRMAEEHFYVYSPIGRRRNLHACMTGDKSIIARQIRRGSNAPIQGFASELGTKSSRLTMETYYKELPKFQEQGYAADRRPWDMRIQFNRIVHDASYYAVPYEMVLPFVHMLQWQATYGLARTSEKQLGIKFTVEPEIEVEFGTRDDHTMKWDWTLPNLVECIEGAVQDAKDLDILDGTPAEVMEKIFAPYRSKKTVKYLQKKYPLLGVEKLHTQIANAESDFKEMLKERVAEAQAIKEAAVKAAKKDKKSKELAEALTAAESKLDKSKKHLSRIVEQNKERKALRA
jgi:DNA polymerase I-like protein with 3'-5' exonuclease and polymerase domains